MKYFAEFHLICLGCSYLAMAKQTYDEKAITQYLLGSLPEEEIVRLDELSFTDDRFADVLKSVEKDLVDAYIHNELSGPTLDRFKSFYLASPLRREKVKFAQAFQSFAEKAITESEKRERKQVDAAPNKVARLFSFFTFPRPALQWSFAAAALVLLIAGGWLLFENMRLRGQVDQAEIKRDALQQRERELQAQLDGQRSNNSETEKELARVREELAKTEKELEKQKEQERQRIAEQQRASKQTSSLPSVASFILTPQMRGIGGPATLSISNKTDYVAMQLELESDDYPVYRVALRNQANDQIIWRSGKLKARARDESKALFISLRADLLQGQVYFLQVSGISSNGAIEIISDYPFKVVKQ